MARAVLNGMVADGARLAPMTEAQLGMVVEAALADRDYLLDSGFGAADIMMGYTLRLVDRAGLLGDYGNASAYLERLEGRDACRRALEA